MSIENNLKQIHYSLEKLAQSGNYDVEKYSYSLMHQTSQLEYFYCHLVKNGDSNHTYYHISKKPKAHQLAYFNIGRGFPKEMMDGHWCYIVKNMGYKLLAIPCTSLKDDKVSKYEKIIEIKMNNQNTFCMLHLSDMRTLDIQRIDLRKPICQVITPRKDIISFIKQTLLQ